MPIPLFNSIASWFLKKRIHQIDLFKKYPIEVQSELLYQLIDFAKNTEMGKKFDFYSIKNYNDFRNRIPIISYEDLENTIKMCRNGVNNILWPTPIKWFAKSSGTSNSKSKFIPLSYEALEECHYKGGKDMLSLYYNNNPNSKLLNGKCLRLGGSQELYQSGNTYFGDLSAIIIDNLPLWAEFSSTPSQKTSLIPEWEYKLKAIIDETINQNVTSLAGIPSWMTVLLNEILEKSGKKSVFEIWPEIEVYFHGGINYNPYKSHFNEFFPHKKINYYEIYNASEGFFAIQDQNETKDGLLLMLDYGIFYEFIPIDKDGIEQDNIIQLSDVELNVKYALVITTNGGLWRYKIGDVIVFKNLNPHRIIISGRVKNYINAFGEEIMIHNTDNAIANAAKKHSVKIIDYTVAPIYMTSNKKGSHEWLIEFEDPPKNLNLFINDLDKYLKNENSDYEAKRNNNTTMTAPTLTLAPKNSFYKWLANNNKLGGQHKIPRLSNDRNLMKKIKEIIF